MRLINKNSHYEHRMWNVFASRSFLFLFDRVTLIKICWLNECWEAKDSWLLEVFLDVFIFIYEVRLKVIILRKVYFSSLLMGN